MDEADGYGLDPWVTRFDGFTQETLAGLVADGLADYDPGREVWVITGYGTAESFEVRNVDAPAHGHAEPEDTSGPPFDALIDRAIIRFEAGQAPDGPLDSLIYRALGDADAATGEGTTTRWRDELIQRITESGPLEWYEITYAGQDPVDRLPVRTFDEEAARHTAARMSGSGGRVDVTYITGRGRQLIASYANRQPLPGTPASPADLSAVPPPRPATLAPGASGAAGPPLPATPGDTRTTPAQFPHGISPLPVTATSGGRVRPGRLLYADGTPVDFRPIGSSRTVAAVAAGAVPGEGDLAPGWLQVIQLGSGDLQKVHPALISPRGVSPLDWLPIRQIRRFGEFDSAEATGRDSAMLPATLIDRGDHIRTAAGEVREVIAHTDLSSASVKIATTGPGGPDSGQQYARWETVEVMIPARHPAQDSPVAGQLFAVTAPPAQRTGASAASGQALAPAASLDELTGLQETLDWIRRDGAPAPGRGVPGNPGRGQRPGIGQHGRSARPGRRPAGTGRRGRDARAGRMAGVGHHDRDDAPGARRGRYPDREPGPEPGVAAAARPDHQGLAGSRRERGPGPVRRPRLGAAVVAGGMGPGVRDHRRPGRQADDGLALRPGGPPQGQPGLASRPGPAPCGVPGRRPRARLAPARPTAPGRQLRTTRRPPRHRRPRPGKGPQRGTPARSGGPASRPD